MRPWKVIFSRVSDRDPKIRLRTKLYPVLTTLIPELDRVLLGGFQRGCIIHLYGDPGSGKSNFAMQVAANLLKQHWHVIWFDCNSSFSINRLSSMLEGANALLKGFQKASPRSFEHQTDLIKHLKDVISRVGLIVVDPITHFYRAERYHEGSQAFFHELITIQLSTLVGLAEFQKIPIIVINYTTIGPNNTPIPLVSKGFERVERYRLRFAKDISSEGSSIFRVVIERAPEGIVRGRVLNINIHPTGIDITEMKGQS